MNHLHLPTRDDPDRCGNEGCGLIWSDPVHAPSVALRKLSELPPDLRDLAATERASGPPSVPPQRREDAAPATHTGRPAMHSDSGYVPADAKWLMCPERFRTAGRPTLQCPYSTPLRAEMADHLARVHEYGEQAAGFYLAHPWFAAEPRSEWVKRTAHLRRPGTQNITNFVDGPGMDTTEYCDHPNGFGPNGCPCGTGQPDEDAELSFRNLNTDTEERAIRCPSCFGPESVFPESRIERHLRDAHLPEWPDSKLIPWLSEHGVPTPKLDGDPVYNHSINCPECGNAYIKGNIRRHLQAVHHYTGDQWDDWAESVNFLELPTVPKSILDDMEAVGLRAEREMARFLNPDITMEQIMADAADVPTGNEHKMDPAELEAALTAWWMDKAEQETRAVVPKAVEYGATDLRDIGRDLAECMGRKVTDEEAAELGIFFYLRGKLSRWVDAVKRGDRPSDDTIYDIGVYCRMAQRNRDVGGWPLPPKD